MRVIAVLVMILPIITFVKYCNRNQLMSPINVFTLLYFIRILIPTVLYADRDIARQISVDYVRNAVLNDSDYLVYALLQTFGYFLVIFGTKLVIKKTNSYDSVLQCDNQIEDIDANYDHYLVWGIICTLIGVIDFFLIIQKVGGLMYFFTHLQYRAIMLRDVDVLSWLLIFLHYGPLMIVYSLRGKGRKVEVFLICLIVVCGFMCGLGGRKMMIVMLVECLFIYHYTVKPIKIRNFLKFKYILLVAGVLAFFTVMVQFRTEGVMETFLENPLFFLKQQGSSGFDLTIFTKESYVAYFITVIHYFKNHSFWLGKSLLGIFTAFIPSSLYHGKPPVDDGMYLYSICMGREDIMPLMPTSSLNTTSFPLETFGSMYANFGGLGVVIGMILLGMIINWAYKRMIQNGCRFVDVVIYTQILLSFELSSLRIFQTIEVFIMLSVIMFFVDRIRLSIGRR